MPYMRHYEHRALLHGAKGLVFPETEGAPPGEVLPTFVWVTAQPTMSRLATVHDSLRVVLNNSVLLSLILDGGSTGCNDVFQTILALIQVLYLTSAREPSDAAVCNAIYLLSLSQWISWELDKSWIQG